MQRRITHKSARDKGKNFERHIAKLLNNNNIQAKRVPMSGALSWLKGDVREYQVTEEHVHECKNQETLCLPDWWRQALDQVKGDEVPVLHFTSAYKPMMTVMRIDDFDDMMEAYEAYNPAYFFVTDHMPARKNFWKWYDKHPLGPAGYYETVLEAEPAIVMTLAQYLMLRRCRQKYLHHIQEVSN